MPALLRSGLGLRAPHTPRRARLHRHFTVTGFVSHQGRTALHWHRLGMWLPPGGHVEADEDPVQAVLREVMEETGLDVEIIAPHPFAYAHPPQLPAPASVAVYDIPRDSKLDEPHQHIDLIYFTRPRSAEPRLPEGAARWTWVDEMTLRGDATPTPAEGAPATRIAEDVRELGIAAIEAARHAGVWARA